MPLQSASSKAMCWPDAARTEPRPASPSRFCGRGFSSSFRRCPVCSPSCSGWAPWG
jgi:hypothetical protein